MTTTDTPPVRALAKLRALTLIIAALALTRAVSLHYGHWHQGHNAGTLWAPHLTAPPLPGTQPTVAVGLTISCPNGDTVTIDTPAALDARGRLTTPDLGPTDHC